MCENLHYESVYFAGRSWGEGSNPGVATSSFFFFDRFLPFGFLLFILPADPVSFARFLRKRSLGISNIKVKRLLTRGSIYIEQLS